MSRRSRRDPLFSQLTSPNDHHLQISLILPSGERIERIPAWITRVTQDLSVSPVYDACFWNPPSHQRYTFKHPHPPQPTSVRIYEAHVGISTIDGRIGTYKEFTSDILPRIYKLGYNVIQLMATMEHAYYACELPQSNLYIDYSRICLQLLDTR